MFFKIFLLLICVFMINCDLSIFQTEELDLDTLRYNSLDSISDYNDKLYLFSKYKMCQEASNCNDETLSKEKLCNEYCTAHGCVLNNHNETNLNLEQENHNSQLNYFKEFVQNLLFNVNNLSFYFNRDQLDLLKKFASNDSSNKLYKESIDILTHMLHVINYNTINDTNNELIDIRLKLILLCVLIVTYLLTVIIKQISRLKLLGLISFNICIISYILIKNVSIECVESISLSNDISSFYCLFENRFQTIYDLLQVNELLLILTSSLIVIFLFNLKQYFKTKYEFNQVINLINKEIVNNNLEENEQEFKLNVLKQKVEHLLQQKNLREHELLQQIDELSREKKLLDDLVSTHIEYKERFKEPNSIINSTTDELSKDDELEPIKPKIVRQIGLSKTIKPKNFGLSESKICYEKNLTNNDYADDDEDIVVILDEK